MAYGIAFPDDLNNISRTQIAALIAEKESRTPSQRKMNSQLVYLVKQHRGEIIASGMKDFKASVNADAQNKVLVDISATVSPNLLNEITTSGGSIVNQFANFNAIRAIVPLSTIETLAARTDVRSIEPAAEAATNVGAVTSAGDRTHRGNTARSIFGVTGTGVKIGVISDGVNSLTASKATGDINADATYLAGQAGSGDEGTAMMEILQDLAPGAQLIFATGFTGAASLATNINALHAAGCSIIVDDITYFNESPFQDSYISQAVNSISTSGVLYFSSAGNSGNKNDGTSGTWEGDFVDGGAATVAAGRVHDFGGNTFNTVNNGGGSRRVDLFWADPLGASSNDYDLYVTDGSGNVLRSSTNIQSGTQDPYESINTLNVGERIIIVKANNAAGRFLHLDTGRAIIAISTAGRTRGHNASGAVNAFSVAATSVANSPNPNVFVGGATNPVETFSSDGPRRIFFQLDGTPFTPGNFSSTGGQVLNKPDITAADGVATTVPGFTTFFGTSAAAPHAAAIAALIKSYNPFLTPAQIRNAMTSTALDIEAGGYDRDSGIGIVMAQAAMQVAAAGGALSITASGFEASGPVGGPFAPSSAMYTLTNLASVSINWTAAKTQPWTTLSATAGTLTAGASTTVTWSVGSDATSLAVGGYADTLTFTNTTGGTTSSHQMALTVNPSLAHVLTFPLDSDPNWTRQGEWAFGTPSGGGGTVQGFPDPISGSTGTKVFGINLSGNYTTAVGSAQYLTTGPMDLTGLTATTLRFKRWLNSGSQSSTIQSIDVSTDGTTWTNVWNNSINTISDNAWTPVSYSLGSAVDNHNSVYIRWGHQVVSSSALAYSGWNIDDVEILAETSSPTLVADARAVTTPLSTAFNVTLTGTDLLTPGSSLSYLVTKAPTHGTLAGTPPTITYTPAPGYYGVDAFYFTVNNGTLTSAPSAVTITVQASSSTFPTVGYWRFAGGASLTQDSGGHALGPFNLTNEAGDNADDSYSLPVSGAGSAFPRTVPRTGASNLNAVLFTASESPPDAFYTPHHVAFDASAFTIEAFVNMASMAGVDQSRTIASKYGPTSGEKMFRLFVTGNGGFGGTRTLCMSVRGTNSSGSVISTHYFNGLTLSVGDDYYVAASFRLVSGGGAQIIAYLKNLTTNAALQSDQINISDWTSLSLSSAPFKIGAATNAGAGELAWDGLIDEVRFSEAVLPEADLLITTPSTLDFKFDVGTEAQITASNFSATGKTANLLLNYAPPTGTQLMVVKNTGLGFISGTFGNLAQGQHVALTYNGVTYNFVANYFGGTGNDLVLQWANTRTLAWGWNFFGQLGNNSTISSPAQIVVDTGGVLSGKTVIAFAAGGYHSLVLCSDGTLASCGYNFFGQLGNGGATDSLVPAAVNRTGVLTGKTVVAIAAGADHSLVLCSDGTVAAWGYNAFGQLGNNSLVDSPLPVAVNTSGVLSGKTVVAVAAGGNHSLALCSDGTVASWGYNADGELGNNGFVNSPVPVTVNTAGVLLGKTIISVAAGYYHSLAVCSDGTMVSWGYNAFGQLGNGSRLDSQVPVLANPSGVLSGKTISTVAAGSHHSLALCSDGTLASWGYNAEGELGNSSYIDSLVPTAVNTAGTLAGKAVTAVAGGFYHSLAACSDGTLVTWGDNVFGQLGNSSTTNSSEPVVVSTASLGFGERFVMGSTGMSASHTLSIVAMPPSAPQMAVEDPSGRDLVDGAASVDFGSVTTGQEVSKVFTVRNRGTTNLSGIAITTNGANSSDFAVNALGASTVAPSASTTFTVTFSPGALGLRTAALHISSNDANHSSFDILLFGNGSPEIDVEQPAGTGLTDGTSIVNFGTAVQGEDKTLTFTMRNSGTSDLMGLAITKDGMDGTDFAVSALGASTLAPGAACTFTITFAPTMTGVRSAAIHLSSNDADENPFDINLTGTGSYTFLGGGTTTGKPTWNRPNSGAPPSSLSSVTAVPYDILTFTADASGSYVMKSTGTDPANWDNMLFLYSNGFTATAPLANLLIGNDDFPSVGSAGFSYTLQAGTTYYLVTTGYASTNTGTYTVSISGPGVVTATTAPEISVEQPAGTNLTDGSATTSFASTLIGSGASKTFTVRNTGNANLTGLIVATDGTNAVDFSVGALGLTTLTPGASTTFDVIFSPSASGSRTATLHIASNDADESPFDIGLNGTGVIPAPEIAVEQPAGTSLTDGSSSVLFSVATVGANSTKTFTVKNSGSANLTGLSVTKDGANATDFNIGGLGATTLAPGATTTFDITFTSTAAPSHIAAIHIASNDADENPFDVSLNGQVSATQEFSSAGSITIPSSGSASPYPSTITVSGVAGSVSTLRVKLNGFTHSYPDDVDVFLVAPSGQVCALTSDAGGGVGVTNVNLVFDDAAATAIPDSTNIASGSYRPANYETGEALPPGGSGTIGTNLLALAGGAINGDWKLFVSDDIASDSGSIQSWAVAIESVGGTLAPEIAVEQPAGTGLTDSGNALGYGNVPTGFSSVKTFTIRNPGSSALTGLVISKDGANAGDFTVGALGATTLGSGSSTTFTVTFSPGSIGALSAAIHIGSNDADENPFDIALSGTGIVPAPEIAVEQPASTGLIDGTASISYGSVVLGSNVAKTFTVKNLGSADLTGLVVTIDGSNSGDFVAGALGTTTLLVGASTTFVVTCTPSAPGSRAAAIHIASNDTDENPFDIALSGTGTIPAPEIVVEQPAGTGFLDGTTSAAYGAVAIGSSLAKTFTIKNAGSLDLTGLAVSIDGTNASEFNASALAASVLAPTASTTFTITFSPNANGTRAAAIHISSNDTDENPFDIALTGTGANSLSMTGNTTGKPVWNRPIATTPPTTLSAVGTAVPYEVFAFTVNASGSYTLQSTATPASWDNYTFLYSSSFNPGSQFANVITGNDNFPTAGISGFTTSLVAGTTYFFVVTGYSNTSTGAHTVLISGPGTIAPFLTPEIAVEQPTGSGLLDGTSTTGFGAMGLGGSVVKTFTVRNVGGGNLTGLAVTKDGANAGDFTVGALGATTLGSGSSTTFTVTFSPGSIGALSAAIHIGSNDADENPFDISLSGTGTTPAPEIALEQPVGTNIADGGSKDFGNIVVGADAILVFTIKNTGTADLTGLTISKDGTDAAMFTVTAYPAAPVSSPTGSTTFTVQFAPTSAGTKTAALHIASNDADENPFDIVFSGTGALVGGSTYTINASDRGWYNQSGSHTTSNLNYLTGYFSAQEYRSFFIFALPVLAPGETIISAELRLLNSVGGYTSADATETMQIHEVTTSTGPLAAGTGGVAAFNDLGDGSIFGGPQTVSAANNGTTIVVPLNASFTFLASQQSGNAIAVGGALTTLSVVGGTEAVFLGTIGTLADTQLVLITTVSGPEIAVEQPAGTGLMDGTSTVSFGSVVSGANSSRTFTIRSTGTADLTGLGITIDGANSGDFTVTAIPAAPVTSGGATTFTVQFAPAAVGARTANLQIASNDADEHPFDIALTGTGVASTNANLANLALSAGTLTPAFASVTTSYSASVSNTAASITITPTVENPSATVKVNNVTVDSGAASGAISLSVGSNMITTVVTAQDGTTTKTYTVVVTRAGTPEIAVEQPANTNISDGGGKDFGSVIVGTNTSLVFTIKNTGTSDLTGLTIIKDGTDASMFTVGSTASSPVGGPTGSTTFTVQFAPTSAGTKTAALHIASNDSDENPFDITVTGTGSDTIHAGTVDPGGLPSVGKYTSLAVVNGNPAISYYDETNSDLMYVRALDADGTLWGTPVTVASNGGVGFYTSLFVVEGNPAIAYYDGTNGDLKYVRASTTTGSSWGAAATVDSTGTVGWNTSLKVVNGNPAISYYDATNTNLKYARATTTTGSSWGTPVTLDSTGDVGEYTSLEVIGGNPAVSYFDFTNGDLKYVRAADASGTSWDAPVTVISTGNTGYFTSLQMVNGNPAVVCFNNTNGDLLFTRATDANGAAWGAPITVDSVGSVGWYGSIQVVNGNPAISYRHSTNGDLKYARAVDADGAAWATPVTLDSAGDVGQFTSLKVVNGTPAVSYYDVTNSDLKCVRALDADGTAWSGATVPHNGAGKSSVTGLYSSLSVVNGQPAISYFEGATFDLKYVRAADTNGTAWGTPITVDTSGNTGYFTSLREVGGNPAISYYDSTGGDLRFVRATDINGGAWASPVTVDSTGTTGWYTSLLVVGGNPAIAYHDLTNGDLRYVRAINATGTLWDTPVTVTSNNVVGAYCSLQIVNNRPAIGYYDSTNGDLMFVRAADANGSTWNTPVTVASSNVVGAYCFLQVINGRPAISYLDDTADDLIYIRASDADGNSWGAPVTLDSAGQVGYYTSLMEVGGHPAVSYLDLTNGDLKYVRSSDINGSAWAAPVTLDSPGVVGYYTSLAVVNGNPAVSQHDLTNGDLKYAYLLSGFSPDIAVEQPLGTDLLDGTSSVNIGSVNLGNSSSAVTFTIRNSGSADLTGLTVSKDGMNSDDFNVTTSGISTTLAPNATTTFAVTFTPSVIGMRTAAIHIASNDADENPFDITLTGTGLTAMEAWRQIHFGSPINSGDAADMADPDQDGVLNLLEFAIAQNPSASSAMPGTAARSGSNLIFIYTRNKAAVSAGIAFAVEWSDSLASNSWDASNVTETVLSDDGLVQAVEAKMPAGSGGQRFVRLRVTK